MYENFGHLTVEELASQETAYRSDAATLTAAADALLLQGSTGYGTPDKLREIASAYLFAADFRASTIRTRKAV